MKKSLLTILTLGLVLMPTMGVFGQITATDDADATVVVNAPITISAPTTIDFGIVTLGATVSLPADGGATTGIAGTSALGTATVGGTSGASFTVTYNNPTLSDGTNTFSVTADVNGHTANDATLSSDITSGGTVALNGSGAYYLFLGGDFTAPGANAGTYNTTNASGVPITITVDYL